MAKPSVRFERGDGYWMAERDSGAFTGITDLGFVEFLITSEALAQLPNPDLDGIDRETAIEVFIECENSAAPAAGDHGLRQLPRCLPL